jgi:hypothetical protein
VVGKHGALGERCFEPSGFVDREAHVCPADRLEPAQRGVAAAAGAVAGSQHRRGQFLTGQPGHLGAEVVDGVEVSIGGGG